MTQVIPYLSVKNAIDALELYTAIFDAEDISRSPVPEEQAAYFGVAEDTDLSRTTIHGEFTIDGQQLYISDNFSGKVLKQRNVSILLECDSLDRAQSIFDRAKEHDCTIEEEFKQQFWGDYFGSFVDPYGIDWRLNFVPPQDE